MNLFGKHFLNTEDWSNDQLIYVIQLAAEMKKNSFDPRWAHLLKQKNFLMFFYNSSLRTHMSFETAMTQLGGNAQYRTPQMGWIKKLANESGENLKDAIKVMSRYVDAIGVRVTLDYLSHYGEGEKILKEYQRWSSVPIINMADDTYHPCQALADIMGWAEWLELGDMLQRLNNLKGKKLLLSWGSSGLARPWSAVQSHLLTASRFGMNITLARPEGYDLDSKIYDLVKTHCKNNGTFFNITDQHTDAFDRADVVYVRNWISPEAYQNGVFQKEQEIEKALRHREWITTKEKMARTNNAVFANPMPVDRGYEVTDEVVDGDRCAIYDVAENRLHVQKAILALTMSNKDIII